MSASVHAVIHPPEQTPPGAVHAGRYGQQAGGTHPTGMFYQLIHTKLQKHRIHDNGRWKVFQRQATGRNVRQKTTFYALKTIFL